MALKTKSIYEPRSADDGIRMLITRFYPRGVKKERFDRWEKELSPSGGLVKSYKSGKITWSQFRVAFIREMRSEGPGGRLAELRALAKTSDVTLLCYEKEGEHCHRQIVKELLTKEPTRPRGTPFQRADRIRFYSRKKSGRKASK